MPSRLPRWRHSRRNIKANLRVSGFLTIKAYKELMSIENTHKRVSEKFTRRRRVKKDPSVSAIPADGTEVDGYWVYVETGGMT